MAVYGMADSCYEYDTSEGEVCVTPRPLSESVIGMVWSGLV